VNEILSPRWAFFADHGVRLERVLTDNAKAYTDAVVFTDTAAGLASASSTPAPTGHTPMARSNATTAQC
jgi:hypothetical protein